MRLALLLLAACRTAATPPPRVPVPPTTAERSNFTKTGRYDEAVEQCRAFERAYANVKCEEIGITGENRTIVALELRNHAAPKPVVYIQAGIHAGEIEGKDAGFLFLRDLLDGKVARGALDRVDVVFVPCINPDGHERFGAHSRPNQRGPEEMGFRTNGARLNLNRDYMKADTPEIRAVLNVMQASKPIVAVDIHTTDGAKFEHDVSITVGPRAPRGDHLDDVAVKLADQLAADLTTKGHLPVTFYPSFIKDDDPMSGFALGEAPPRFSQAYAGLRNGVGILVENHSWKTYEHRVHTSYDFLAALFARMPVALPAPEDVRGKDIPVVWDNGPHVSTIPFRGYAFERHPSDITGATAITYDESKPEVWSVPLHDEIVPKTLVHVPRAGYIVDGGYAATVAPVLHAHGVYFTRVTGEPRVAIEAFRATKVTPVPLFEGRARMTFEGAWAAETRTLERGALFVPTDQPLARLAVNLLDPAAPDSLAQWGELATAFERKEYIESYVVEEAAKELFARDPSLRAKFDAALADPAFAKNAQARLDWFYKLLPSWDERLNLLPIYRTGVAP